MVKSISTESIIEFIVAIIVGLCLLPIVISICATAATSLTGVSKTLMEVILPLFYVVGLVLAVMCWTIGRERPPSLG